MKVKEIKPNMLCLEYRQDETDEDYGSCLWARFMFNLDRYELMINSDCGNYAYKWCETPESESFLELMVRCGKDYILEKIYGEEDVFDYDATKERSYEYYCADEDEEIKTKLNDIYECIESDFKPTEATDFLKRFTDEDWDGYFADTFELPVYTYPAQAIRIVSIFEECIKPTIKEILKKQENLTSQVM